MRLGPVWQRMMEQVEQGCTADLSVYHPVNIVGWGMSGESVWLPGGAGWDDPASGSVRWRNEARRSAWPDRADVDTAGQRTGVLPAAVDAGRSGAGAGRGGTRRPHASWRRYGRSLWLDRPAAGAIPALGRATCCRATSGFSWRTRQPVTAADRHRSCQLRRSLARHGVCHCMWRSAFRRAWWRAVKRNSVWDYLANAVGLAGLSMPNFWLGIMLILLVSVRFGMAAAVRVCTAERGCRGSRWRPPSCRRSYWGTPSRRC